jgi:hypothetical protein
MNETMNGNVTNEARVLTSLCNVAQGDSGITMSPDGTLSAPVEGTYEWPTAPNTGTTIGVVGKVVLG